MPDFIGISARCAHGNPENVGSRDTLSVWRASQSAYMRSLFIAASMLMTFSTAFADSSVVEAFGNKWSVSDRAAWQYDVKSESPSLKVTAGEVGSPQNRLAQIALLDGPPYSRVTLEADVMTSGTSLAIVFAYRDAKHFNYVDLGTEPAAKNPNANGIFHVYGGDGVRISPEGGPAAVQSGNWQHVSLTHDADTGIIGVKVNGKTTSSFNAVDLSLGPGRLGLGVASGTASFRNVKVIGTPAASTTPPK